jgi:hypothetical protein
MSATTAAAKPRKNSRKSRQTLDAPPTVAVPALPLPERVAARLKGLAAEAQCADLAEGAGDPEIAGDTVRQLMAHQLAAGHDLMMVLGARAGRLVREGSAGGEDDDGRRSMEMLRFVAGTARLMERCRAAALALDRIGYPEPPEGPDDNGPQRCDHPHHYAWRLAGERKRERRCVLDWLAQGKKPSEMPDVEGWPPYHNPDPDIEKLDERLARGSHPAAPRHAASGLHRGRLKNGNPSGDYLAAPRCGAATRAGGACRQPAMANSRCRFHGGKSTGPRTAEGRRRAQTARLVHGFRTAEIIDLRSAAARTGRNLHCLTRAARAERERASRYSKAAIAGLDPAIHGAAGISAERIAPNVHAIGCDAARVTPMDRRVKPGDDKRGLRVFVVNRKSRLPLSSAGHGVHRSDFVRSAATAGRTRRRRCA